MKLQCEVDLFNRLLPTLNIISSKKRAAKSVLALGKELKDDKSFFLMLFSSTHKLGTKYKVNDNIEQVFCKYCHEGKATIRLKCPPNDMRINADPLQLKIFLKALKLSLDRNVEGLKSLNLTNISVVAKNTSVTKLIILDIHKYPLKGLPRTLNHLQISGINMFNFKREVLMLRSLKILDLSHNSIQMIPLELGKMPHLLELYLGNNNLGCNKSPDWQWLEGDQIVHKLRLLDLSSNKLGDKLPHTIKKLTSLVTLKLDKNELKFLPRGIGKMTNLKYLNASYNDLTSLPANIRLLNLDSLDLSSNSFNEVTGQSDVNLSFRLSTLVEIAGSCVLRSRLPYSKKSIPYTLVDYLDMSFYCICGSPTLDIVKYDKLKLCLKQFCRTVILESDVTDSTVNLDCYYCSMKCYHKFSSTKRKM